MGRDTAFLVSLRCCQTDDVTAGHARHMRRCVDLAKRASGKTRPNPIVGCVVLSESGLIVGEGFHERAGGPHAEVVALGYAGSDARNGTAYVSLEPCNHYGRTPPCVDALLKAGVSNVVVGMVDPDPRTAGKGVDRLRENGVNVDVGIEEDLCQSANAGFVHRILNKEPLGTWKYAMTLDGKIASDSGSSKWVSGPSSRAIVQGMRRDTDAIIVGGNTLRRDDPRLTVRDVPSPGLQPIRVVMSKSMDLPLEARMWDTAVAPTVVFTSIEGAEQNSKLVQHLESCGVTVLPYEELSPRKVMNHLYESGCLNVLWECGGNLAAEAIADRCIHRVTAFIAPKLIGGQMYTPLANFGLQDMGQAWTLEKVDHRIVGEDIVISGSLAFPS